MKVPIRLKKDLILLMSNQTLRNEETTGDLLFKTPNLNKFISGVILYDETIAKKTLMNYP